MRKYFLLFVIFGLLCACTSSKSTVSENVDLAKYKYASILSNDTYNIPAELLEYEIQLYDAVEGSGLAMVGNMQVYNLTPQQQSELLMVKYGINQTSDETIVTINFIDYLTGRPIASCRGAYGLGLTYSNDLSSAIKRVAEQIKKTFQNK